MKILILGQTPPPWHGQAVMINYLAEASWNWTDKKLIRLDFSGTIEDVGKIKIVKFFKLFSVIYQVWRERLSGKIDTLYYVPTATNRVPFYRDIILLLFCRWTAKKIIFHFHAGGFDTVLKFTRIEKCFARLVYKNPDCSIILTPLQLNEIKWINSKAVKIIPNGIPDEFSSYKHLKGQTKEATILFLSNLFKEKGVWDALYAAKILANKGLLFKWIFVGGWESTASKDEIEKFVSSNNLQQKLEFRGPLSGCEKWDAYANADIFCFPSFALESFGVVLIEAMMFELPIVATNWRSIPYIVQENVNGLLVPVNNSNVLSEKLEELLTNSERRTMYGKNSRELYLSKYELSKYITDMEDTLKKI